MNSLLLSLLFVAVHGLVIVGTELLIARYFGAKFLSSKLACVAVSFVIWGFLAVIIYIAFLRYNPSGIDTEFFLEGVYYSAMTGTVSVVAIWLFVSMIKAFKNV